MKSSRDSRKVLASLKRLTEAAKNEENLLHYSCECAENGATVGEISDALEEVFGRYSGQIQSVSGVYVSKREKKDLKKVYELVEKFSDKKGRRPRMLVGKIGQDGHDRGQKVVASSFADLGFDVDIGPLFQTVEEVAKQCVENDVHVLGISSLAAGHLTFVPDLMKAFKDLNAEDILVVLGGVIPPEDYGPLKKMGVHLIFGPGTKLDDAAVSIISKLLQ